ncbi:putative antitermination protein Q [Pseudomonas aeruginosa]|nr:putative antitermination protein Q [Pseudomonas aeruginosa]
MQQVGKLLNLNRLKVRELLIAGRCYVEAVLDMRERIAIRDAA